MPLVSRAGGTPLYPSQSQDPGRWEAGPTGVAAEAGSLPIVLSSLACSHPRSELIQLVAVTQKTAERSYREHIEQQIQTYQRRWASAHPPAPRPVYPPATLASQSLGLPGPVRVGSVTGNRHPVDPSPLLVF